MRIKPIKTDVDYQIALKRVEEICEATPNTKKGDELSILILLIEDYESRLYEILPPDPIEAIKFRMKQTRMRKSELEKIFGGRKNTAEILGRKKPLTLGMLKALHRRLQIPAISLLAEVTMTKY